MITPIVVGVVVAVAAPFDSDDVRDVACDVTASDDVCDPAVPDPPTPPRPPADVSVGGGAIGTLLVLLLVLALAAGIVWLVVRVVRDRQKPDGEDDADELDEELDEPVDERIVDHDRPPDRWRAAAARHREAGEYRSAIRCEYRGLVGDLARAGLVDEIPGRTSGEERAQLAELAPSVAPDFARAADLFDVAWFDDGVITTGDDEAFLEAQRTVLGAVMSGSRR